MICEATVHPAKDGFGMYERHAEGLVETGFDTLEEFTAHLDREYIWRWAEEIDGNIYNQNGGKPFAWRAPDQTDGWSYGLVYTE